MIEGLRILPWLQERIRNKRKQVEYLLDCDKCRGLVPPDPFNPMRPTTQAERQTWGCAYEPRNEAMRPCGWMHQGYRDEPPTTCPGYTTKLPEVVEINRARLHVKTGSGRDFLGGPATENILRGIEILEGAVNEANCWREDDK